MIKIFSCFIFFIFCFQVNAFASADYEVLKQELKSCNWKLDCHYELLKKYKQEPLARYYYAKALMIDKDYYKAKENFEILLSDSKLSPGFRKAVQDDYDKIKQQLKDMHIANSNDYGNYIADLEAYYTWKNPANIKVFIKESKKKELFKQAFHKWDYELYQLVNFEYVSDESQADIVCCYVKEIEHEDWVGITRSYRIKENYTKAIIEVKTVDEYNNPYNDKELLSIILHEIGHALGIRGHSKNLNDIMYFSMDTYKNGTISRKDVNTVLRIYNLKN